jgi:hypothetical protein
MLNSVYLTPVVWLDTYTDVPVRHASRIHVFWDVTPSLLVNNCQSFERAAFEALVTSRFYSEDEGVTSCRKIGDCASRYGVGSQRMRMFRNTGLWPPALASQSPSVNCVVSKEKSY